MVSMASTSTPEKGFQMLNGKKIIGYPTKILFGHMAYFCLSNIYLTFQMGRQDATLL